MIWRLAWRYVFSAQRDAFLVVIVRMAFVGIMLGVAALVVVLAVMRGFHKELLRCITQIESHVTVTAPPGEKYWLPAPSLLKNLREHPDVERMVPLTFGQGAFVRSGVLRGMNVRGVSMRDMGCEPMIQDLREQEFKGAHVPVGGAVIGVVCARELGVQVGDTLDLILPHAYETMVGVVPMIVPVRIVGIAETRYYLTDANTVLVHEDFGARILRVPKPLVHRLDIYARTPEHLDGICRCLEDNGVHKVRVHVWYERHASFIQTLQVERLVMTIILTLMILVAGFNVVSGLMMFVRDKRYDTALLRLMGCPRYKVASLYMSAGSLIAMGGVVTGVILGVVICAYIEPIRRGIEKVFQVDLFKEEFYMLGQVPADCGVDLVFTIAGIALCVSMVAVWFPARRAAKQSPLECLRYEM